MNASDKRNYLLRFHRFQKSRETYFAPKIFAAIRQQYKVLLDSLDAGYTEQQALYHITSEPIAKVLKNLYVDAATIYGAKVRSDLNRLVPYRIENPNTFNQFKEAERTPSGFAPLPILAGKAIGHSSSERQRYNFKARMPMGFSESMRQLILDYFSVDILNQSEGITDTTRELIRDIFTKGYELGEGIDDIVEKLKDTELSRVRSRLIARTETVTAANQGSLFVAKSTGLDLNKEWLSASDNRVRLHHRSVNGQIVGVDDFFNVGGYQMKVPGDRGGHNGQLRVPPEEVCNCRCTTAFIPID